MAVVRITVALKGIVLGNARQLFADKVEKAKTPPLPVSAEEVYNALYAPWIGHITVLPKEFFYGDSRMHFRGIFGVAAEFAITTPDTKRHPLNMPAGYYIERERFAAMPTFTVNEPHPDVGTPSAATMNTWVTLRQYAEARNAAVQAVLQERKNFLSGVEAVLDAHATLAPALKIWPALWDLLPEDARAKHAARSAKAKRESVEICADVQSMTSVVVANKLLK